MFVREYLCKWRCENCSAGQTYVREGDPDDDSVPHVMALREILDTNSTAHAVKTGHRVYRGALHWADRRQ